MTEFETSSKYKFASFIYWIIGFDGLLESIDDSKVGIIRDEIFNLVLIVASSAHPKIVNKTHTCCWTLRNRKLYKYLLCIEFGSPINLTEDVSGHK